MAKVGKVELHDIEFRSPLSKKLNQEIEQMKKAKELALTENKDVVIDVVQQKQQLDFVSDDLNPENNESVIQSHLTKKGYPKFYSHVNIHPESQEEKIFVHEAPQQHNFFLKFIAFVALAVSILILGVALLEFFNVISFTTLI
jgi:hypothetical protein